jgi:hypothetical protein
MKYLPNWMWLFGQRYQNSFVWVKEVDEHRGQSSSESGYTPKQYMSLGEANTACFFHGEKAILDM